MLKTQPRSTTSPSDTATEADVIVVGSGAAGMTAAIVAAASGMKVTVLEKTAYIGGASAWSGGVAWVPNNHLMTSAGVADSPDLARQYIKGIVGEHLREDMVNAFLRNGPRAIEFLDKKTTAMRFMSYPGVDYYPDLAGAISHRGVMPRPYDGRELGTNLEELQFPLRQLVVFKSMQADVSDVYHLQHALKRWSSLRHSVKLVGRYAFDRLRGSRGTRLIRGNALAARLYRSALDLGVTFVRNAAAEELHLDGQRVAGVMVRRDGSTRRMTARHGVILASGGLSASGAFRRKLMPFPSQHQSMLPDGNVGDGISMAMAHGARMGDSKPSNGCLVPVSVLKRPGGTEIKYPHLAFDRCKPGSLIVDKSGKRFTNEVACYHDVVKAMQAQRAVPAYLIADYPFLRKYGMGLARPFPYPVKPMVESGYLIEAPTVPALAKKLGIDPDELVATVGRMNDHAKSGVDPEFGRGGNSYNRALGDPEHGPNPCLGAIGSGPFYAVKLYPGDVGTFVGLQVNPTAQVLDEARQPIPGLYACGLDIDSVFSGFYPGAGSMHGPNITFAFVAAEHLVKLSSGPTRVAATVEALTEQE